MNKKINRDIFKKLELELLFALFDYAVPFIDKKINTKTTQKQKNLQSDSLESIIKNQKPKINADDFRKLEVMLSKSFDEKTEIKKVASFDRLAGTYSINFFKEKILRTTEKLSITFNYEENNSEEMTSVSVKKGENEIYSAVQAIKKPNSDKVVPYSIKIVYENDYSMESLSIVYSRQNKSYMQQHIEDKHDTTKFVPLKFVNILPETMMGGVLGFTYLGNHSMGRRADLTGSMARMVDIHESIHTPDEYETRCLTQWIMSKEKSKYIR